MSLIEIQVRELWTRNLTLDQIAKRLWISHADVERAMKHLNLH